jgi:hypothetical protein
MHNMVLLQAMLSNQCPPATQSPGRLALRGRGRGRGSPHLAASHHSLIHCDWQETKHTDTTHQQTHASICPISARCAPRRRLRPVTDFLRLFFSLSFFFLFLLFLLFTSSSPLQLVAILWNRVCLESYPTVATVVWSTTYFLHNYPIISVCFVNPLNCQALYLHASRRRGQHGVRQRTCAP